MSELLLPRKRFTADHPYHIENIRVLEDWARLIGSTAIPWTSKPSQADGDISPKLRHPVSFTAIGFAFSVEGTPTSTMTIKLRKSAVVIATATLASGGNEYSAVTPLNVDVRGLLDPLTIELTTLGGATLPLLAYVGIRR